MYLPCPVDGEANFVGYSTGLGRVTALASITIALAARVRPADNAPEATSACHLRSYRLVAVRSRAIDSLLNGYGTFLEQGLSNTRPETRVPSFWRLAPPAGCIRISGRAREYQGQIAQR